MEEILDDFTEPDPIPSRKGVDKSIWLFAILTAGIFLFYELVLRHILPENLGESFDLVIRTKGIYMTFFIIIICNLVVRRIHNHSPGFDEKLYVIWGASTIFYGDVIFRLIMDIIVIGNISIPSVFLIFQISMITSILGGTISYIVIHRLKNKSVLIPYLLLIGIWVALFFLIKVVLS